MGKASVKKTATISYEYSDGSESDYILGIYASDGEPGEQLIIEDVNGGERVYIPKEVWELIKEHGDNFFNH